MVFKHRQQYKLGESSDGLSNGHKERCDEKYIKGKKEPESERHSRKLKTMFIILEFYQIEQKTNRSASALITLMH